MPAGTDLDVVETLMRETASRTEATRPAVAPLGQLDVAVESAGGHVGE